MFRHERSDSVPSPPFPARDGGFIKVKDDSASRVRLDGPYCVVSREGDACSVVFTSIHFCERRPGRTLRVSTVVRTLGRAV